MDQDDIPPIFIPTAEELADADRLMRVLVLSHGKTPKGEAYWAYVAIMPSLADDFMKASQSGQYFDYGDFGEVVRFGYGEEPPEDVKQFMTEEYGANHQFHQEVMEKIDEMQKRKNAIRRFQKMTPDDDTTH